MRIELRPQGCMAYQRNWEETGVALTQVVSGSGGGWGRNEGKEGRWSKTAEGSEYPVEELE